MKSIECSNCGVAFGLLNSYERNRREDHRGFYCPNGHAQHFPHESDTERYKRLMESAQAQANAEKQRLLVAQKERDAAELKLKKLKKRAAAGVCPCCNRTVSQLAQHMRTKHNEFMELNGVGAKKGLPAPKIQ